MKRSRPAAAAQEQSRADEETRRTRRLIALLLFTSALAIRLLFWHATPDRDWAWSAYFKGDAPVWLDYAQALERGEPFELGLPVHPPGAGWLTAFFWNGSPGGIAWLRCAWIILGALIPPLLFLAAAPPFGIRVAAIAGTFAALSSGLLLLSTGINSETPYLVLTLLSFRPLHRLLERATLGQLVAWSALNAAACLFRVEHVLFYAAVVGLLMVRWSRSGAVRAARWSFVSLAVFALVLLPWHLSAWSGIRRFNEEPRRLTSTEERAIASVEQALADIPWTSDAVRKRDELPAFLRRTLSAFVLTTVHHRGGRVVRGEDFGIVEEAFGYWPRPLSRFPFVSSSGPLNFALANHRRADGGFSRAPLDDPPPLQGGEERYPSFLIQGLPPEDLTFIYPPHLRLFNHGYAIGWRWIRENPREAAALASRKLAHFWSGASLGFTGHNAPLGISGTRRAVDIVAPDGSGLVAAWRMIILLIAGAGLAAGLRMLSVWPWLLFLGSKVAVAVLFFGYARLGVTIIPVIALLFGLAVDHWLIPRLPRTVKGGSVTVVAAILLGAIMIETARVLDQPLVNIDGRPIRTDDPFPGDIHRDQRLDVR